MEINKQHMMKIMNVERKQGFVFTVLSMMLTFLLVVDKIN